MILQIGDNFNNRHMPNHSFVVTNLIPRENKCWVRIIPKNGQHEWTEKDWNLTHTLYGFERGEYNITNQKIKTV